MSSFSNCDTDIKSEKAFPFNENLLLINYLRLIHGNELLLKIKWGIGNKFNLCYLIMIQALIQQS